MAIDYIAQTIDDEHIRYHLDTKSTLQVAVGVEQHVVFPAVVVDKRLDLIDILTLINRHGKNLHTRFFLPVGIHLADGVELAVAGLAPGGKEIDDKRFTAIRQRIDTHGLTIHCLQRHLRQLGKDTLHRNEQ